MHIRSKRIQTIWQIKLVEKYPISPMIAVTCTV